jgi:hypothetical protein
MPVSEMAKPKFKKTVIWQGPSGQHFLCRVVNVGRESDDLKIIATDAESNLGAIYTEATDQFDGSELVRLGAELTYHADGAVLHKMLAHNESTTTEYRNPGGVSARRTPLDELKEWEPFARYTVVRATPYSRRVDDSVLVVPMCSIFGGAPFQCTFFVGPSEAALLPEDSHSEHLRISGVGQDLDLLLRFEPSSYRGETMRLPNTGAPIFVCSNVLQVMERQ